MKRLLGIVMILGVIFIASCKDKAYSDDYRLGFERGLKQGYNQGYDNGSSGARHNFVKPSNAAFKLKTTTIDNCCKPKVHIPGNGKTVNRNSNTEKRTHGVKSIKHNNKFKKPNSSSDNSYLNKDKKKLKMKTSSYSKPKQRVKSRSKK